MIPAIVLSSLTFLSAQPLALPQEGAPSPSASSTELSDVVLERAWSFLHPDEKHEIAEWFRAEAGYREGFQAGLLRYLLDNQKRDPGTWPVESKPKWFDPETHAPAQVIPRSWLDKDKPSVAKFAKRIFKNVPERQLWSAWRYDYAAQELRRNPDINKDEQIFHNGMRGFAPDFDLAEALVEMKLDDGALQKPFAAFAHAYTDRLGNAYPGITLYDAWASGEQIEMPDVDCLGIIHTLEEDWKRWRAPVPGPQQRPLYDRIAEHFVPLRQHRGLRHALARAYLAGSPVLRDGYGSSVDRLHFLWEEAASTPSTLRESLPQPSDWGSFLVEADNRLASEKSHVEAARNRRAYLEADSKQIRALLVSVMKRFGALERRSLPRRDPPPVEEPK